MDKHQQLSKSQLSRIIMKVLRRCLSTIHNYQPGEVVMNLDVKTNGLVRLTQSFYIILGLWHLSCDVVYDNSMTEVREANWIVLITVSFLKCKAQCSLDKKSLNYITYLSLRQKGSNLPHSHLVCRSSGCYHSASKTRVRDKVFKLSPIHASMIYPIPSIESMNL